MLIRNVQTWGRSQYATNITEELTVKCHNFTFIYISVNREAMEIEMRTFLFSEGIIVGVPRCIICNNQPFAFINFVIGWIPGGKVGDDTSKRQRKAYIFFWKIDGMCRAVIM
jgi:hypothetical protein